MKNNTYRMEYTTPFVVVFLPTSNIGDNVCTNIRFLNCHLLSCLHSISHFEKQKLEQIQDKFVDLSSPNVCNLIVSFKHRLGGGYNKNILELKSKCCYDCIHNCCFPRQILG
jgi:hypothetical protein